MKLKIVLLVLLAFGLNLCLPRAAESEINKTGYITNENCPEAAGCSGHCECNIKDPVSGQSKTFLLYNPRQKFKLWDETQQHGGVSDKSEYFLDVNLIVRPPVCAISSVLTTFSGPSIAQNVVPVSKDIADCQFVLESRLYCCCRLLEAGKEAKKYTCEQEMGTLGQESTLAGGHCVYPAVNISLVKGVEELHWPPAEVFELPPSKNCADLETQGKITPPPTTTLGITPAELLARAEDLDVLHVSSVSQLVSRAIIYLITPLGLFALALYIWAGALWMTAGGKPERITTAKQIIIWTSLGIIMVLASYIFVSRILDVITAG